MNSSRDIVQLCLEPRELGRGAESEVGSIQCGRSCKVRPYRCTWSAAPAWARRGMRGASWGSCEINNGRTQGAGGPGGRGASWRSSEINKGQKYQVRANWGSCGVCFGQWFFAGRLGRGKANAIPSKSCLQAICCGQNLPTFCVGSGELQTARRKFPPRMGTAPYYCYFRISLERHTEAGLQLEIIPE